MKPYWMIGIVFVMMAVFVVAGVTQQTNAQSETLHGNKMNGAVALPTAASVISSLQGKTWRLTSFTNESGSASVLPGTAITAVFGADGKVTGSAGCNNYFAGYQLSGNGIKIGPVGSTLMWCGQPPGVMAQETTYLKLLQGSTTYSTNGTELKLSNGTNANQLIFKAPVPCLMS
jgi:heat shock protein HslJ